MIDPKKQNHLSYLKFFYGVLRFKIFGTVVLNIAIGFLDGIGLTMLIPLLQSVDGNSHAKQSMGQLQHLVTFLENLGLPITVTVILLVFLAIFFLKAAIKFGASRYQNWIQNIFVRRIQMRFLSHLRKLSYKGYLQLDAGSIQNTVLGDVWRVSEALKCYLRWTNSLFMLLTYVFLAYLANPKFAFLITISVSLSNLMYRRLFKRIKEASYEMSRKGKRLSGYLIEMIRHFKYLKSTNYIQPYSLKLQGIIDDAYALNRKTSRYTAIITSIKEPIVVSIVVLVMIIQIHWVGGGVGSIVLSLLLFYRGLNSMMSLQGDWQSFLNNSGAFRSVTEASEMMKRLEEKTGSVPFSSIKKEIRLENIGMSFGRNKVLNDINICIEKNTTVALTGVSGSGKTTLVNIISGLLKPDSGHVVVDNVRLSDYNLNDYRGKIGYISQESVVFNDTIFNNITFWAEPTPENLKRFWDVARMSSLSHFIDELELKENTRLGDNGILISGGQRQRISIARELYKKPELLILDEATSSLDSETEHIIQENIENLHGHYTMIIIAHRLSTIKQVDEIYLLEKGKIVNSGTFEDMLERSSTFKNLVSLQGL